MMKSWIFGLVLPFASSALSAQVSAWQPPPGHTQARISPGKPPDGQPGPDAEPPGRAGLLSSVPSWTGVGLRLAPCLPSANSGLLRSDLIIRPGGAGTSGS